MPAPIGALDFRRKIEERGKLDACKLIRPDCESVEQAEEMIRAYILSLLAVRKLASAGVLLWGESLFNPRPECVQKVWRTLEENFKALVMGGASVGKSYTGICWVILDWWADPANTTVKLISTTGAHARNNTFGTMQMLHKESLVKMHGFVYAESIRNDPVNERFSISIVRIRDGEDNSGVLQGFHPLPRTKPHPIYGKSTRVRIVLDEAEEIPNGVWTGCDNALTSISGQAVKVFAFWNPKDITKKTAQLAEPRGGWGEFDMETGVKGKDEWVSRMGWKTVRIDPAKTENVKQRKEIFPQFQTYEGYLNLHSEQSGNSLRKYAFGRGCYPPDGTVCVVISQATLNAMRKEFIWCGPTTRLSGEDIAIDGRDDATMGVGRLGMASGAIIYERDENDRVTKKTIQFREPRKCIQLDQIFDLPKGSPKIVGDAIKQNALRLEIAAEWSMSDRTGNGAPVHDYLCIPEVWSPQVRAIDFSQNATDIKILEQDRETPVERFEGIHTEVWFAVAILAENGYLAIAPSVKAERLERELIGRKYKISAGKKLVVEKKDEYKMRLGCSPDHADAFTIFVHCARVGGMIQGSMTGESNKLKPDNTPPDEIDYRPEWMHDEATTI